MRDLAQHAPQVLVRRVPRVRSSLQQRRAQQLEEVAALGLQLGLLESAALQGAGRLELAAPFSDNRGFLFVDQLGKLRDVVTHDSSAGDASGLASTPAPMVLRQI